MTAFTCSGSRVQIGLVASCRSIPTQSSSRLIASCHVSQELLHRASTSRLLPPRRLTASGRGRIARFSVAEVRCGTS